MYIKIYVVSYSTPRVLSVCHYIFVTHI